MDQVFVLKILIIFGVSCKLLKEKSSVCLTMACYSGLVRNKV